MLLSVFNLHLHPTYPISADSMSTTICALLHRHPVLHDSSMPALPPSRLQTRSKDSPIIAMIRNCSPSLIILFQPTPLSAENLRGVRNVTREVIKYLADGHVR